VLQAWRKLLSMQVLSGIGCSVVQQLVKVLLGVEEAARRVQVLQVLLVLRSVVAVQALGELLCRFLGRAAVKVFGKSYCAGFCAWRKVLAECVLRQQHVSYCPGWCMLAGWMEDLEKTICRICLDVYVVHVLPLERIVSKAMNYMAGSSTLMLLMSSTSMYKKNESIYFHAKKNESSFLLECNSTKIETIFSP
jgi:hypothetical protein